MKTKHFTSVVPPSTEKTIRLPLPRLGDRARPRPHQMSSGPARSGRSKLASSRKAPSFASLFLAARAFCVRPPLCRALRSRCPRVLAMSSPFRKKSRSIVDFVMRLHRFPASTKGDDGRSWPMTSRWTGLLVMVLVWPSPPHSRNATSNPNHFS
jgi:hypothetical protein